MHKLDDEIGAKARINFALAGRQLDICKTVLAVPELGGDQLLKERVLGSGSDRNVAAVGEREHAEGVVQALGRDDVSGDHGNGADVELGRVKREHEGQRIIGAGIGVEDDFLGCGSGGRG